MVPVVTLGAHLDGPDDERVADGDRVRESGPQAEAGVVADRDEVDGPRPSKSEITRVLSDLCPEKAHVDAHQGRVLQELD